MAERRISYAPDVENGESRPAPDVNDTTGMDEYGALNRYISTARDGRRGSTSSAAALSAKEEKKPWWKFWGGKEGGNEEGFVIPDEWVDTDMRTGLSSSDIEGRRKRTGWNELTTEKTNFFIQFIGYFRGPILYGEFLQLWWMGEVEERSQWLTMVLLQLWNLLFFWLPVCVTGLISVSSLVFLCLTRLSVGTRRSRPPMSLPRSRVILP